MGSIVLFIGLPRLRLAMTGQRVVVPAGPREGMSYTIVA